MEGALGQLYQKAGSDKAPGLSFLLFLHLPTLLPPYQPSSHPLNIFPQAITALSSPRNALVPDLEVTDSLLSFRSPLLVTFQGQPELRTSAKGVL